MVYDIVLPTLVGIERDASGYKVLREVAKFVNCIMLKGFMIDVSNQSMVTIYRLNKREYKWDFTTEKMPWNG